MSRSRSEGLVVGVDSAACLGTLQQVVAGAAILVGIAREIEKAGYLSDTVAIPIVTCFRFARLEEHRVSEYNQNSYSSGMP